MYCKKCGKELDDGVKFCTGCGAPVIENSDSAQNSNVETDVPSVNKDVRKIRYII